MAWRIITFLGLFIMTVFLSPILSIPAALWYAARWYAPEIIIGGWLIDLYFGVTNSWPIYTISACVIILAAEFSKRYLMLK